MMAKRAKIEKFIDVIKNCDALHTEYLAYEAQYVHRAHDELYALLEKIYGFVSDVLKRNDKEDAIAAVRKQLKDEYGIKTTNKMSVIGVMEPPVIVNIEPVMIEIMEPIGDRNYRASW